MEELRRRGGWRSTRSFLFALVLLLLTAAGILEIVRQRVPHDLGESWPERERRATLEAVERAAVIFARLQSSTEQDLREAYRELQVGSLLQSMPDSLPALFGVMEEIRNDASESVELLRLHEENAARETPIDVAAWSGRPIDVPSDLLRLVRRGSGASFIDTGAVSNYLVVLIPAGAAVKEPYPYALLHAVPVELTYPIANRFVRGRNLSREISQEIGADIEFVFRNGSSPEAPDTRGTAHFLTSLQGTALGEVVASPIVPEGYIGYRQEQLREAEGVLISVAGLLAALVGAWYSTRISRRFVRLLVLVLLLWGVRILFLVTAFPFSVIGTSLADPTNFASSFGFGLARSPGDFVLTAVTFLLSVAASARALSASDGETLRRGSPSWGWSAVGGLVVGGLVYWAWRGAAALAASAVTDSTIDYGDSASLLLSIPGAAVVASLIGLTLGFVLILHILISLLAPPRMRILYWVMLTPAGMTAWWISPNPLMEWHVALGLVLLVVVPSALLQSGVLAPRRLFLTILVAVVAVGGFIAREQAERTRHHVELLASSFVKPQDAWLTYLVQETLRSASGQRVREALSSPSSNPDENERSTLAFLIWAESPLGKQGYGAAVTVLDTAGKTVSQFTIGERMRSLTSFLSRSEHGSGIWVVGGRTGRTYIGTAPITGEEGETLGSVCVAVPSEIPFPFSSGIPELLRPELPAAQLDPLFDVRVDRVPTLSRQRSAEASRSAPAEGAAAWMEIPGSVYEYSLPDPGDPAMRFVFRLSRPDMRWDAFVVLKTLILVVEISLALGLIALVLGLIRRRRFSFRFRLLTAFLFVSLLPVLYLAAADRRDAERRFNESLGTRLRNSLDLLTRSLSLEPLTPGKSTAGFPNVSAAGGSADSLVRRLAQLAGVDVHVYSDSALIASSTPELFASGLLDDRLNGMAYAAIVLRCDRFFQHAERIGDFTYEVGYAPAAGGAQASSFRRLVLSVPLLYREGQVDLEIARRNVFGIWPYAGMVVLAGFLGWLLSRRISAPVIRLTEAAEKVSRGDLAVNVESRTRDELDDLVRTFNGMVRDLRESRELVARAEREAAWREMAKQVAHEIKNPLTPMKLGMQQLLAAYRDAKPDFKEELDQVARTIIDRIESLRAIASEFSYFARMPEPHFTPQNPSEILSSAASLFESERDVAFVRDFADTASVIEADRDQISRLFINVIRNAVQAVRGTSSPCITLRTERKGGGIEISIHDNGPGIPPEVRPHLFEPNFSTKSEGMGLGLAIVRQIVDLHGGEVEVKSEEGKGATFIFRFPVSGGRAVDDGGANETREEAKEQ